MTNKNVKGLSGSFHVVFDKVKSEAQKLSIDNDDPRQLYASALFLSIVEHVGGIHSLLEVNPNVAVLILRATLEANIHLALTKKLPNYHERQQLNFLADKLKRLKSNKDYPHFSELNDDQASEEISKTQSKISQYEDRGIKQYNQWFKRFEEIGEAEKYVLYQRLCDHAHHNIGTLYDRHLDGSFQLGELTIFKLPSNMNKEGILAESAKILVESLKLLAEISGQDGKLDLGAVDAEYLAFISTLMK